MSPNLESGKESFLVTSFIYRYSRQTRQAKVKDSLSPPLSLVLSCLSASRPLLPIWLTGIYGGVWLTDHAAVADVHVVVNSIGPSLSATSHG
jgi:hypothetical protein